MDFLHESNRIYARGSDGDVIAEITFPDIDEGTVDIDHTYVAFPLRGQGVAGRLMELVVEQLVARNKKAVLTCSYAVRWFEMHPEYGGLLKE